jgi:hypothetical protein
VKPKGRFVASCRKAGLSHDDLSEAQGRFPAWQCGAAFTDFAICISSSGGAFVDVDKHSRNN